MNTFTSRIKNVIRRIRCDTPSVSGSARLPAMIIGCALIGNLIHPGIGGGVIGAVMVFSKKNLPQQVIFIRE